MGVSKIYFSGSVNHFYDFIAEENLEEGISHTYKLHHIYTRWDLGIVKGKGVEAFKRIKQQKH